MWKHVVSPKKGWHRTLGSITSKNQSYPRFLSATKIYFKDEISGDSEPTTYEPFAANLTSHKACCRDFYLVVLFGCNYSEAPAWAVFEYESKFFGLTPKVHNLLPAWLQALEYRNTGAAMIWLIPARATTIFLISKFQRTLILGEQLRQFFKKRNSF